MTRVNTGIRPAELSNSHLIAELREIKRIPNCITKGRFSLKNIPENFKLGQGHVSFFYNKLTYLKNRYTLLHNEAIVRGFKIQDYTQSFDLAIANNPNLANDYQERLIDRKILIERLIEKDSSFYEKVF